MLHIYARPAKKSDIPLIDKWLRANADNLFDESILSNPNTKFYCAVRNGPLVFLPTQAVMMLESLGVNPEATDAEVGKSIEVLMQAAQFNARNCEYREMWFMGRGPIVQFAAKHGWEVVAEDKERNVTVLRWKLE